MSAFAARNSLRAENSSPRTSNKAAELEKPPAVSTNGQSASSDSLVIPVSVDAAPGKPTLEFEGEEDSDSDAEKNLDSEEGAPNSSYVNTMLYEDLDADMYAAFNHGPVPLEF